MLRNYSRSKKFKYCSQIGGSESIRDIQEAKNIDADAFEFQIVESLFSVSKIIQALQRTYSDSIEELASKFVFINISSKESLELLDNLHNLDLPIFLNKENIIINFDRRGLIKSLFKLQNEDFEVADYEIEINSLILASQLKNNLKDFSISISGGLNLESLSKILKSEIAIDFFKTGLFTIPNNKEDKYELKENLHHYQSLEVKLINIMSNSLNNKTDYLKRRKTHLTDYLIDILN